MHKHLLHRGVALPIVFAIAAGGLRTYTPAQAQQTPPPPMFENVTIGPKFSPDTLTVRGISGGSVPGKNIAGRAETANGPCVGFVDEKPDHTLVLTDFFNYLSLKVQSPNDTTIIVRGPGGTWCNDDSQGKNPGIAGEWLAGNYNVWVGSFDKSNYHPYRLRITKNR